MKIIDIFQMPTGTIVNIDIEPPAYKIDDYVAINGRNYKIKGSAMHNKSSLLIEKAEQLENGQEIKFLKHAV